jgi:hypothetical protein
MIDREEGELQKLFDSTAAQPSEAQLHAMARRSAEIPKKRQIPAWLYAVLGVAVSAAAVMLWMFIRGNALDGVRPGPTAAIVEPDPTADIAPTQPEEDSEFEATLAALDDDPFVMDPAGAREDPFRAVDMLAIGVIPPRVQAGIYQHLLDEQGIDD